MAIDVLASGWLAPNLAGKGLSILCWRIKPAEAFVTAA
jgi:hypothetical protein